jgi:hypothetical protein
MGPVPTLILKVGYFMPGFAALLIVQEMGEGLVLQLTTRLPS